MHYLIYKITNRLDNKIYVGKHKTEDKNDDYFGSGLLLGRAVEKHGKENFVKEILFDLSSEEEMNRKEADIVDEDFVARDDTYNIKLGGQGGFDYVHRNRKSLMTDSCRKASISACEIMREKRKHLLDTDEAFRDEWREKCVNKIRAYQFIHGNNTFLGKRHTEETKKKISASRIGKVSGSKNPAYGKHWITNGIISSLVPRNFDLPSGFRNGRV
jgi:hypothetical protein